MVTDDGKVLIIDEFTGRVLAGRRWSDGLHQAVEAKENVRIQEESRTMATITFQNLFRLYKKLAGMTGTADTEAPEFHKIYKLDVVAIPTNKPIISATTTRTSSTRPSARSSTRSSTRSSDTTSRASPCSSARPASRRATRSRACSRRRASRTTC